MQCLRRKRGKLFGGAQSEMRIRGDRGRNRRGRSKAYQMVEAEGRERYGRKAKPDSRGPRARPHPDFNWKLGESIRTVDGR